MKKTTILLLLILVLLSLVVFLQPKGLFVTKRSVQELSIMLIGDVMLGRTVTIESLDSQKDPVYPFREVLSEMKNNDLTILNLENPIIDKCPRRNDGMVFCAPPEMLKGLVESGVDAVNLANNHTLNYGSTGLVETKAHLREFGINYFDSKETYIKEVNGVTVGFIGFDKSQLANPTFTSDEEAAIRDISSKVDILVVSLHWGVEYQEKPTEGQRKLAIKTIKLGADIIHGHHPHWVQPTENIEGVPVFYSLGNFVFDQMWSQKTREGKVARVVIKENKVNSVEEKEIFMDDWARPSWRN